MVAAGLDFGQVREVPRGRSAQPTRARRQELAVSSGKASSTHESIFTRSREEEKSELRCAPFLTAIKRKQPAVSQCHATICRRLRAADDSSGGQQPREVVTRVREYMKANKLSQCQISQATQISQAVISQWREHPRLVPSFASSFLYCCSVVYCVLRYPPAG